MKCPECGEEMFRKIKNWECPNCGCTYITNYEIPDKFKDYINAENLDKVKEGMENIAEQIANQAQKEGDYIKSRRENNENSAVNDFLVSKVILDGVDFVKIKKQEISKVQNAKYARQKEEREEEKVKRGEEKVQQESKNRPENALFYIDGREGTLAIFDEFIQLDFTGSIVKQYLSKLGGVKKIYYPQINSIQKRDAGEFILGAIEFELPGMSYSGVGGGKKENIIHYEYYYQEEADKIYEFVNQKILNIQRNNMNPHSNGSNESNVLSELKKAKELLDMGALTQEEFDNIKKDLLK